MQPIFHYKKSTLYAEDVNLNEIAHQFGTPTYIYSKTAILNNLQNFIDAFGKTRHRIFYAVKANSNIAILQLFAKKNIGFDIVSLGELERVIKAQGDPQKIVFSGVAKTALEISRAIDVNVGCFNVESVQELERIQEIASAKNKIAAIALRINPNIDAKTHPFIATGLSENKFGISPSHLLSLIENIKNMSHIQLIGIACHIGSQITELTPFLTAIDYILQVIKQLKTAGFPIQHINIGGGLGVCYQDEEPPTIQAYVAAILKKIENTSLEIIIEPGRSLLANAGILLTKIEYIKQNDYKYFAITDAGMNDLCRPALYNAWHNIIPVNKILSSQKTLYDIVGPVCESSDFLGKNRELTLVANDLLAILSVGAYGFCMSSNYNSRLRPAEIMIDHNTIHLIRERETIDSLIQFERLI